MSHHPTDQSETLHHQDSGRRTPLSFICFVEGECRGRSFVAVTSWQPRADGSRLRFPPRFCDGRGFIEPSYCTNGGIAAVSGVVRLRRPRREPKDAARLSSCREAHAPHVAHQKVEWTRRESRERRAARRAAEWRTANVVSRKRGERGGRRRGNETNAVSRVDSTGFEPRGRRSGRVVLLRSTIPGYVFQGFKSRLRRRTPRYQPRATRASLAGWVTRRNGLVGI